MCRREGSKGCARKCTGLWLTAGWALIKAEKAGGWEEADAEEAAQGAGFGKKSPVNRVPVRRSRCRKAAQGTELREEEATVNRVPRVRRSRCRRSGPRCRASGKKAHGKPSTSKKKPMQKKRPKVQSFGKKKPVNRVPSKKKRCRRSGPGCRASEEEAHGKPSTEQEEADAEEAAQGTELRKEEAHGKPCTQQEEANAEEADQVRSFGKKKPTVKRVQPTKSHPAVGGQDRASSAGLCVRARVRTVSRSVCAKARRRALLRRRT